MTPIVSELFLRTQSDERLVSLARGGHNQAFVAIVSRYQRELLLFARRSGPEARAEDVVQQAMLNAFVALRGGTEVTHLRGWLYTIVRRGLAKAAAGEPVADAHGADAAITEPLEDVVLRRARARDTLAAVRGLPSRQRTALIATVFQGQRRSDIAQTLGQSEGAVRQLVHRARHNVRNAVGAVMPYPLARWVLPFRGGSRAGAPVAEVAGSSAMDGTVGLVAKFGAVLASGALAAGIVAVPHRAPRRAPSRARGLRRVPGSARVVRRERGVCAGRPAERGLGDGCGARRLAQAVGDAQHGARIGGRPRWPCAGGRVHRRRPAWRWRWLGWRRLARGGWRSGSVEPNVGIGRRRLGRLGVGRRGSGGSGSDDSGSAGATDGGSSHGGSGDGGSSTAGDGGSGDGGTAPRTAVVLDGSGSSSGGGSSGGGSSGSRPAAVAASGGNSGQGGGGSDDGSGGGDPSGSAG